MSICKGCSDAADANRAQWDAGRHEEQKFHPACDCPCQHRPAMGWEDYFSFPKPSKKDDS